MHWKGLPESERGWEPAEGLWQFQDKIDRFHDEDAMGMLRDQVGESVTAHQPTAYQLASDRQTRILGHGFASPDV